MVRGEAPARKVPPEVHLSFYVDLRGIEPLTSCLPSKRSTN